MGTRRRGTIISIDRLAIDWWVTWWQNGEGSGGVLGYTVAQVFTVRHKFKFVCLQVSVPCWRPEMEWNRYVNKLPGTECDTQNVRRWCMQRESGLSCSPWKFAFQDLFIAHSVLRHLHTLFQRELSTECDLVSPLSVSSILFFPLKFSRSCLRLLLGLPIPSIFPSITRFIRQILR